MGRLVRLISNSFIALSFLLCIATAAFWFRSYRTSARQFPGDPADVVHHINVKAASWLEAASDHGKIQLLRFSNFEITDKRPPQSGNAPKSSPKNDPFDGDLDLDLFRYNFAWRGTGASMLVREDTRSFLHEALNVSPVWNNNTISQSGVRDTWIRRRQCSSIQPRRPFPLRRAPNSSFSPFPIGPPSSSLPSFPPSVPQPGSGRSTAVARAVVTTNASPAATTSAPHHAVAPNAA